MRHVFLRLWNKSLGKLKAASETKWTDVKTLLRASDEKYCARNEHKVFLVFNLSRLFYDTCFVVSTQPIQRILRFGFLKT